VHQELAKTLQGKDQQLLEQETKLYQLTVQLEEAG
jgi:hypothetical protein